jgi:hypothetical protein
MSILLRFADSGCPFGVFRLFLKSSRLSNKLDIYHSSSLMVMLNKS